MLFIFPGRQGNNGAAPDYRRGGYLIGAPKMKGKILVDLGNKTCWRRSWATHPSWQKMTSSYQSALFSLNNSPIIPAYTAPQSSPTTAEKSYSINPTLFCLAFLRTKKSLQFGLISLNSRSRSIMITFY